MSLRCPHCLSPIPQKTARCPVCGQSPTTAPIEPPAAALRLLSALTPPATGTSSRQPGMLRWLLLLAGALTLVLVLLASVAALALAAAAAGLGAIAWPALTGIVCVFVLAVLLAAERRRHRLAALLVAPSTPATLSPLELVHLFAGHFAVPAHGADAFWPPLAPTAVRADEAAWRAIAATLLDLAQREIVELEPHAVAVASGLVTTMSLRLVRPLPPGDPFATHLLHPLARRGVGVSSTVSDLVSQHLMLQRHPARTLLESARDHLSAQGFYRPPGIHPRGATPWIVALPVAWLSAALFLPLRPDPARIAQAEPALAALQERLATWDTQETEQVRILRHEVCAGLLRARARGRG